MAYFIALGILSLAGIVATVWLVRTDGYGSIPTDPSRVAAAAEPAPRRTWSARSASPAVEAAPGPEAARPALSVTPPATTRSRIVATE